MDEEIDLGVPRAILDSLPDDEDAERDMKRAVAGLEERLNQLVADAADADEAVGHVLDALDHLERRMERYDEFVPELRAWGQSPIYAVAWRNLHADLAMQLEDHDWLADRLDRERNYRLVDDGIRFRD